jgi:pimeloyl-ACP methyl ester carboxylesterase
MTSFSATTQIIDGYETTTYEGGAGPTLLFLHGAGGAADMFEGSGAPAFLVELAKSFRVLVPEHPGYGARERPAFVDNIHDLAYFYLDYLKARGLNGVHLVGQSLGGWVALEIAVRNTARLASLTVAGAAGIHVKGVKKGDIFMWTREQFAQNMFRNADARAAFMAREMTPAQQTAYLRNRETTALLAWEPRLFDPNLEKWLHRIDVPTHVIWAADDRVLPATYGETIAGMIGGARLSVIPDTGHLLHLDRPAAFSAAVADFIREEAA